MGTGQMTTRRWLPLLGLLAVMGAGCFGPRPSIVRQKLDPPQRKGDPWILAVTVLNDGPGKGEAEIVSRLRNEQGEVVAQEQREVDLQPHETVTVSLKFDVVRPGPYRATSEVQAPPQ